MSQRPVLRSPLKDKTLRNPGQSVDKAIFDIRDSYLDNLVVLVVTGSMLLTALLQWLLKTPPLTLVYVTAFYFAVASILYLPKMFKKIPELKRLRQARDGERAVAECLDLLRDDGHRVFHDIVGPNFNIDHVIIGQKGIFTVETKTLNKHVGKDAHLYFDGERVCIGKLELPDNPVPQGRAQAGWLKKLLAESTGKTLSVKPVVVFPGWFVERVSGADQSDTWVLEPKALRGFLKSEPVRVNLPMSSLPSFILNATSALQTPEIYGCRATNAAETRC